MKILTTKEINSHIIKNLPFKKIHTMIKFCKTFRIPIYYESSRKLYYAKYYDLLDRYVLDCRKYGTKSFKKKCFDKFVEIESKEDEFNEDGRAHDNKYLSHENFHSLMFVRGHPHHINGTKILFPDTPIEKILASSSYRKKDEAKYLAEIYDFVRKMKDFVMNDDKLEDIKLDFQKSFPKTYKTKYYADTAMCLIQGTGGEIPGVIVEINENDHSNYNPKDEDYRRSYFKTQGYMYLEFNVKGATDKSLDAFKQRVKHALYMQFSQHSEKIDDEALWDEIEEHDISRDFYDIVKKPLVSNEFCITHVDIAKYLGYSSADNYKQIVRAILSTNGKKSNLIENVDYKTFTAKQWRSKIAGESKNELAPLYPSSSSSQSSQLSVKIDNKSRKIVYLLNMTGLFKLIFYSQKPKARACALSIVKIYQSAIALAKRYRAEKAKHFTEDIANRDTFMREHYDKEISKIKLAGNRNKDNLESSLDESNRNFDKLTKRYETLEAEKKSLQQKIHAYDSIFSKINSAIDEGKREMLEVPDPEPEEKPEEKPVPELEEEPTGKKCKACHAFKNFSNFRKHGRSRDGYVTICNSCK